MKTKKDNELHHLIQFKQVFDRFPDGEIFEHECPDFIVDNGNRKVGIEVTKIFKAPRSNEPPMQAAESACKKIADFAQKICEGRQIPPLIVSLHFIQKPNILNIRREELSYKIADFVCSNIPNPDSSSTFEDRYNDQTFPEYIHAITIGRFKVLTKSHFNVPTAGWAQREFSAELQQVIDLKNQKLVHYNNGCEEHWLIIISEGFSPSSFFECNGETREAIFKSEFDRSFFMEAFSKSWWELKTFKRLIIFLNS